MKPLLLVNMVLLGVVVLGFLLMPRHLTSFVQNTRWYTALTSDFGTDSRVIVMNNGYPWRAIGLIHGDINDPFVCSGFLVGPARVATSAHCLVDEEGRVRAPLYFRMVRQTNFASLTYLAVSRRFPRLGPSTGKDALQDIHPNVDLAIIEIATPIGESLGYLGTHGGETDSVGNVGSMVDDGDDISQQCAGTIDHLPWRTSRAGADGKETDTYWSAPALHTQYPICAAGFSADLGYARLSVADDCYLLAMIDGVVFHSCRVESGASGGPLFYVDSSGKPVAFAVNTGVVAPAKMAAELGRNRLFVGTLLDGL